MPLNVVVARERLAAVRALVGFGTAVDAPVHRQQAAVREATATDGAQVRFLTRVRADVLHEEVRCREALGAHRALVRPLARVHHCVPGEVALIDERLVAHAAFVRFLARVNAFVGDKAGLMCEGLAADGAHERPLARVDAFMREPLPVRVEGLVAYRAAVLLAHSVAALVLPQTVTYMERHPTVGALERPQAGVRQRMVLEAASGRIRLTADRTFVLPSRPMRVLVSPEIDATGEHLGAETTLVRA